MFVLRVFQQGTHFRGGGLTTPGSDAVSKTVSTRPREHPLEASKAAQNVVPLAVNAGDNIEAMGQWASGRCLSADPTGVYSRSEVGGGGRMRRMVWEPGVN